MLLVGNYIRTATPSNSKYVTSFYESAKVAATAAADMQHFISLGESTKAVEIVAEKGDLIALNKVYTKYSKMMSTLSKQMKAVESDPMLDGESKRAEIERLQQLRVSFAAQAEQIRKQIQSVKK